MDNMSNMKTVLYVDDEDINLTLFKINFKDKFNIVTASSGSEGLEIIENNKEIVAVISDMKMPGMNGIEFINIVKQNTPDMYCFILTGFDINDEIEEALNKSLILKYFRKPFNAREINRTLESYIG